VSDRTKQGLRRASLLIVYVGIIAVSMATALVWLASRFGLDKGFVHQFGALSLMAVLAICVIALVLVWLAGGFAGRRSKQKDDGSR